MTALPSNATDWIRRNPGKTLTGLLGCLAIGVVILTLLFLHRGWVMERVLISREWSIAKLQSIPPSLYFVAMAVLPAFGFPLSFFYLTASTVMAGPMTGLVLACAAVSINVAISYWLARGILHPLAERLVRTFGYSIPQLKPEIEWKVIVLVRISPMPFPMQNYLLGLARARFWQYWWISSVIQWGWAVGVILLADSFFAGRWQYAAIGGFVLLLVGMLLHWLRKRMRQEKAVVAAAGESNVIAENPQP